MRVEAVSYTHLGITNGTTATTFSPYQNCTRAQIITYLWRAAGSPEPASMEPAYTDVTFQGTTFNNVMRFNYQLYTSPWSQLGELKFDDCTFNGIIVGATAAQTLTFDGCEFTDFTNTTDQNNSNPTWIRPAYGNWSADDNEEMCIRDRRSTSRRGRSSPRNT